jgi:signal transduction histidine kinase
MHLELSVVPRLDRDGNLRGLIHVGRDVTARRDAEEGMRRLNAELEGRVRERTTLLERSVAEMETFAYAVAHDLRTPLRAIDGFSRILLEDHGEGLDEVGRDCVRKVVRGAGRMGELIDALLALAHCSRARLAPREVDLSAIAGAVARRLAAGAEGPAREVAIETGLVAHGDPALLRTVLEHLLSNAWKFTAGCAAPRVRFGAETDAGGARAYFVRDNGAGFDMAHAGKLFGTFQRLHDAGEYPGTGIGLATVRRIVERHGGSVRAEGEPGAGATFFFTLGTTENG